MALLPAGPKWFPEDMETDQPLEVIVAEFVREKILRSFRDEVPHAIGEVPSAHRTPPPRSARIFSVPQSAGYV